MNAKFYEKKAKVCLQSDNNKKEKEIIMLF